LFGQFGLNVVNNGAIFVLEQTRDSTDAVSGSGFDAQVAVDTLVLIDLEFVVAEEASHGMGLGLGVVEAGLNFTVNAPVLGQDAGHGRGFGQDVIAKPIGLAAL